MTLEQIEAFTSKFCDKCQDKKDCTFCYVLNFLIQLQIEWQLQELRDMEVAIPIVKEITA